MKGDFLEGAQVFYGCSYETDFRFAWIALLWIRLFGSCSQGTVAMVVPTGQVPSKRSAPQVLSTCSLLNSGAMWCRMDSTCFSINNVFYGLNILPTL
jgi:hypothetical protein